MKKDIPYNGSVITLIGKEGSGEAPEHTITALIDSVFFDSVQVTTEELTTGTVEDTLVAEAKKKIDGTYFSADIKAIFLSRGYVETP